MTPRRQDDDGAAATQTQGAGHNENVQPRANGRPLTGDQVPRPGTTATRGRSAERAIQTVLNLVRHVSAFSDDIDRVANSYNNEIEQGKQIEELSKSLEQTKLQESEELVELRKKATWLEKLKKKVAEAEEKHREIVADLNHDHTVQIAAKESELRSNKQKLQKLREVLKAEAKRESQKECEELEAQRGRLTEELQCLEKKTTADAKTAAATMATMNTTIENKDSRYQRAEENFERLERRYKAELEKLGSEFAVDMNPPDFYQRLFQLMSESIEGLVGNHFYGLPPDTEAWINSPKEMPSHASHNLAYTPISKSPVSEFLRQCNVHHIISGHLKAFVDRSPFILCGGAGKTIDCQQMDKISEELLKGAGLRGESVWRILTLGGLGSEGSLKTEQRGASPQVDVVVKSVIKALQPMMLEGGLSAVETTLSAIFNMAEAVWSARRKDSCQLMISTDPADNPHLWKAVPELHPEPIEPKLAVSADIQLQYMCTFPRIIGSFLKNDEVVRTVLHQGEMLPSDAQALQGGLQEWSEIRQAAEEGARNKRSEHSRRKTSLTRPIEETMPRLTTGAFDVDPR